jgi:hypothetical protein
LVDCNLLVRGNRHVEVLERHVAPAAVVIRQGWVRRTEVSCCYSQSCAIYTPSRLVALELKACPAAQAVVKEGSA